MHLGSDGVENKQKIAPQLFFTSIIKRLDCYMAEFFKNKLFMTLGATLDIAIIDAETNSLGDLGSFPHTTLAVNLRKLGTIGLSHRCRRHTTQLLCPEQIVALCLMQC